MTAPVNREQSNCVVGRVCAGCGAGLPENKAPGRARKWCSDRCRKGQYGRACENCGAPTDGSNGRERAPKLCKSCRLEAQTIWSRERIIERIRAWADLYGAPPGQSEWNPAAARVRGHDERVERYYAGDWPSHKTVKDWFGSWNAAIEAAGFTPRAATWNESTHRNRRRPQRVAA